jgi:hypothetical protein
MTGTSDAGAESEGGGISMAIERVERCAALVRGGANAWLVVGVDRRTAMVENFIVACLYYLLLIDLD